jgi:hypothetical protein
MGGEPVLRSRLIDTDPITKVRRILHTENDEDGTYHAEAVQPIKGRLDINAALQNEARNGYGEGQRVASIPLVIWEDLIRKGIANDTKKLKAWLNDPDNRAFRTRLGRV